MLSHCLNPSCRALFRYMDDGRIFQVERRTAMPGTSELQRLVEYYWLCGPCSQKLKVVVENGNVSTVPSCAVAPEVTAGPEVVEMSR